MWTGKGKRFWGKARSVKELIALEEERVERGRREERRRKSWVMEKGVERGRGRRKGSKGKEEREWKRDKDCDGGKERKGKVKMGKGNGLSCRGKR